MISIAAAPADMVRDRAPHTVTRRTLRLGATRPLHDRIPLGAFLLRSGGHVQIPSSVPRVRGNRDQRLISNWSGD